MILSFQKRFVPKILNGTKMQTIRLDSGNRWHPGRKIHFWAGNPRNVSIYPFGFGEAVVKDVFPVRIYPGENRVEINMDGQYEAFTRKETLHIIAVCDGFASWKEMKQFFTEDFEGKIIVWENTVFTAKVIDNNLI